MFPLAIYRKQLYHKHMCLLFLHDELDELQEGSLCGWTLSKFQFVKR